MVVITPNDKPQQNFSLKKKINAEINEENGEEACDGIPEDIKIIAQEIQIVKSLACNDLSQRNRQLKKLRKWLQLRTTSSFPFSQEDFIRIWKGLYYNMWYSDKPLVQEELAEKLGRLLECFTGNMQYCVDFFGAFLKTMCIEWFGIDQWRIDKYLMLTRRMLRYMFQSLKSSNWSLEAIELFNKHATETVLFENVTAKGLTMHYFDIFFEELAKVSEGDITADQVGLFIEPFVKFIATQRDSNLISHCRSRIFYHLLYQSSLGREYTEKYNAWKEMGFPSKHIGDLEKIEVSENDEIQEENVEESISNKHLDPRAGNVDVFMPELLLNGQLIIIEIEYFLYKEECTTKRRKLLKKLLDLFKRYQNGEFPLGVKTMPRFEGKSEKPLIKEKIRQLDNLENELYGVDRKLKQMTKRKRRKFLKSLNFDDVDESNYDQTLEKAFPKEYLRERRKRSHKSLMTGWIEEELNEEDLQPKRIKKKSFGDKNLSSENVHGKKYKVHSKIIKRQNSFKSKMKKKKNDDVACAAVKEINGSKISEQEQLTIQTKPKGMIKKIKNQWDEPLADGETEFFLPSRKLQIKKANAVLVLNPLAKQLSDKESTPVGKGQFFSAPNTPKTLSATKRVKIALKHNTSQNPVEYIQQIKSSPDIPFDAKRKPGKGLLKPNAMPSPINPFYKKKIGLKLLNDTF